MTIRATPTQHAARSLLVTHASMSKLHRRGHEWVETYWRPAVRKLERSARSGDVRLAADAWSVLGDLYDLNGTPRAALAAYRRSIKLRPNISETWHAIGATLDNMGELRRARHALLRARALAPDDELLAGDLERVEWAMFNRYPVLYEQHNHNWHAAEALAAGHHGKALRLLARKRGARARQIRAQVHAARGDVAGVLREWGAIGELAGKIQLLHADWYYTLRSRAADDPALWRLMLWKVRNKLDGGAFHYSPTLTELELSHAKRFELYVRFELARCERDVPALLALAGKYPSWREPGETALRIDSGA